MMVDKWRQLGKCNEILSDAIGDGTRVCEWVFIGKDVVIGKNCVISNGVEINSGSVIGDNTNIQSKAVINSNTKIGKHCHIGVHVITADEYHMTPDTYTITRTPCEIGDNVRIGGGANLVCCKIGDNSVIGANSLVLSDVPKNQVWVGSPAKYIRDIGKYDI